jgi:Tol biopolymer transport system component
MRRSAGLLLVSAVLSLSASSAYARHGGVRVATGGMAHRLVNGRISFGSPDPRIGDVTLWTARADGTHRRRLTHEPSFFSDWSPSGRRIAYDFLDSAGNEHIATIRPNGNARRQITFEHGIQEIPRWSPDGHWITFDASPLSPDNPAFFTSIWVMRADGSDQRRITHVGFDGEPVFSPNGRRIAFGRITGFNANGDQLAAIYVVDTTGKHLRRVVAPLPGLEHPDWSPDGRWITFNIEPLTGATAAAGAILAVHPNGRGLHILRRATARLRFFKAVWSPDGRKMLSGCHDARDDLDKLCVIDVASERARITLSRSPFPVNFPAWGPRPSA